MKNQISFAMVLAATAIGCADVTDDGAESSEEPVAGPRDKTTSPGADLSRFPKLPPEAESEVGATRTAVAPAVRSGDVYSVEVKGDGSGSMTIYTPPAGLTGRELFTVLRERGVPGLRDPALGEQGVPELQVPEVQEPPGGGTGTLTSCSYGTAMLFRCGVDRTLSHQVHWANNGFAHPQVYFADHTGSQWPVDVSTYRWNQAQGIDSWYRWASCPNIAGTHCVHVREIPGGPDTCWQGLASVSWNSSYNITGASIQLNNYNGTGVCNGVSVNYAKNANGYRQDACHEMGHTLGMGHNSATSGSCLYGTIMNSSSMLVPSSQDFTLIARLYSIGH